MKVVIYTQPGCYGCEQVKAFFREAKIPFREINIHASPSSLDSVSKDGVVATPLIVIGNKKLLGFDKQEIINMLRGGSHG